MARRAALSFSVGRFWTTFASTGSPSADPSEWPALTEGAPQNIVLNPLKSGAKFAVESHVGRPAACELWDQVDALARGPVE